MSDQPTLSILIPFRNEESVLPETYRRLRSAMDAIPEISWEIIGVDDGSDDASATVWKNLVSQDDRLSLVRLRRNFGKEAALLAGMRSARGQAVIPMDADLQDPPELIPAMVARWKEGFDQVIAVRTTRQDPLWKRLSAALFYRLMNLVSDQPLIANAGDFRLLDRCVVDVLIAMPETDRYTKGLYAWVGGRQTTINYDRPARIGGKPSQSISRLCHLAVDGILGHATAPLRILLIAGLVVSAVSFLYAGIVLTLFLTGTVATVPGYPSLLCLILFFGGMNMAGIGLIGEYLARIYRETKHRPAYVVLSVEGQARVP